MAGRAHGRDFSPRVFLFRDPPAGIVFGGRLNGSRIILLGLAALSGWAGELGIHYISDFDDTIKITNTPTRAGDRIRRGLFRRSGDPLFTMEAFAGMTELLQRLAPATKPERKLTLVSGSPPVVHGRIRDFIRAHSLPLPEDRLRLMAEEGDIESFKREALRELFAADSSPVIFLGDDIQADPQIYRDFREAHSQRVKEIYIHHVKGGGAGTGTKIYANAFDVAVWELLAGRLDLQGAIAIGEATLEESASLYPSFVECPIPMAHRSQKLSDPRLVRINDRLAAIARKTCDERAAATNSVLPPKSVPSEQEEPGTPPQAPGGLPHG